MRSGGELGWAATTILIGTLLILGEILTAQVILSPVGNVLAFCGSATVACQLLRGETGRPAELM